MSITHGLAQMDELNTVDELIFFTGKLLKSIFNVSKIAVALRDETNAVYQAKGVCGLPEELGCVSESQLSVFINPNVISKSGKFDNICKTLLPTVEACNVISFPLEAKDVFIGFIAFFDADLNLWIFNSCVW